MKENLAKSKVKNDVAIPGNSIFLDFGKVIYLGATERPNLDS